MVWTCTKDPRNKYIQIGSKTETGKKATIKKGWKQLQSGNK